MPKAVVARGRDAARGGTCVQRGNPVTWDTATIVSIAGGLLIAGAGFWVLWAWRDGARAHEDALGPTLNDTTAADDPGAGPRGAQVLARFSVPTRLVIGLSLLIMGYHVAVWGMPDLTPLRVPKQWWWVLVAGLTGAVGLSMLIDRVEQKRGGGPSSE